MAGEHAAEHDEIRARPIRLGDIARDGAAAVGADLTFQPVRGVGAFDDRRKLRIADAGHPPRGADRAGADADLHDVRAGQDQRLGHVAGDDVAGHHHGVGIVVAHPLDRIEELFRIAVGDVEADEPDRRRLRHYGELFYIRRRSAKRIEGMPAAWPGEELDELRLGVVLVQGGQRAMLAERVRHRHGAGHVHVGGDERKALPFRAGVEETERATDVDGAARVQRRTLGANEDVLEIELDVGFDTHGLSSVWRENGRLGPIM